MKRIAILLCILELAAWSSAETNTSVVESPTIEKLELIRTIPHSGYSEGLDYQNGFLWNSLPKEIVKIDSKDGTVVQRFSSPTEHGESLKWLRGKLVHVSFKDNGIYSGTLTKTGIDFIRVGSVPEEHAWGLEFDGKSIVMTGNYSDMLYFVDPKSWKVTRRLKTTVTDIEDLAWDGKRFWASSFTKYRGQIFAIDPKDGKVGPFFLLPNPESCPVIDGLAYDGKGLWITGKECPSLFYVKLPTVRATNP